MPSFPFPESLDQPLDINRKTYVSPNVVLEEPRAVERSLTRKNSATSLITQGLRARTMGQQVQSCFTRIVPVALNAEGELTTIFATPGILLYHNICVDTLRAADISFENAIFVWHTMRRLTQLSKEEDVSAEGRENLRRIISELKDRAEDASHRLGDVHTRQKSLLSSPMKFLPSQGRSLTNFALPTNLEEGNVTLRIAKLIKAQMIHMVGEDNIPDIFQNLHNLITHSDTILPDQLGIVSWIQFIITGLNRLSIDIANKPPAEWIHTIRMLYKRSFVYVAQIPLVNDNIPRDNKTNFLEDTRMAITRMRNIWYTVTSVDEILPKAVRDWQTNDLDCASRAILWKRGAVPRFPGRMVDFIMMITHVEKLPSGHYGLSMNVRCRFDDISEFEHNPALFRCDILDMVVSLRQLPTSSVNGLRLRITDHSPSQEFYDKTERKYGAKLTGKVVPNALGEVGFEASREITKANYSVMEARQRKDDAVHWRISRNEDSSAGISDCDLRIIIDAPAPEIQVEVHMEACFKLGGRFTRMIPFLMRPISLKVNNIVNINVEEALAMEFSTSQGVEEFLAGCKLTKPS